MKPVFFERIIFAVFLTAFIITAASQAVLFSPHTRASVIENHYIDGEPLREEAYLFVPCRMELKLADAESCPELKVLVNGVEKGSFEQNTILLELKDGDVVELDAEYLFEPVQVRISAVTGNIKSLLGKSIRASDGITPVARIETAA